MHIQEKNVTQMKVIPGGNQMSLIRDTEEVIKFLEFVGRKSILNEQSVHFRLTACHNLFSVVNEEEDNADYILSNLDLIVNRFRNKNGNVQASTLKVYKSRVKSSLEDYKSWSADPFQWERALTEKSKAQLAEERKEKKAAAKAQKVSTPPRATKKAEKVETGELNDASSEVVDGRRAITLPIRPGLNVDVSIPAEGLTLKELQRITMFLYPYCTDVEDSQFPWLGYKN